MSKTVTLDKRWKEVIFAASGLGPNLLMVLMMAYFTDAVIPTGLNADINFWSYGGVILVSTIIFPLLWTLGRIFDGVIDVPLAALTDRLKNKKGNRFITILISFFPMVVSFVLCWIPVFGRNADITLGQQIGNSLWIFFWSIIFFASYTLALITFYGSLSEVCKNQTQRARVSAYKSVFDTISYALVYAAIPAVFKAIGMPIWQVALYMSPLMLTILIPYLFKRNGEVEQATPEKDVGIGTSIALTFKSRPFMKWMIVNCVAFFGLQMFLVSQNTLISGIMNLGASWAAVLNTCAFAPVPLMLFFFNKLRKKVGLRFVYQTCLLSFAIAIFSFLVGSQYFFGDNIMPKLIIGAIGGVCGSWGIGAFFMMPYLIPTVIASVEEEITNKNHSAMYFAVQALTTSVVGAIASSLVYNYLKLWVVDGTSAGHDFQWKCGVSVGPFIVAVFCVIGFFLCFMMPRDYSAKVIYEDVKKSAANDNARLERKLAREKAKLDDKVAYYQNSDISENEKATLINEAKSNYELLEAKIALAISENKQVIAYQYDESKSSANEESKYLFDKESHLANVGLFILSGGIFGLVSYFIRMARVKKLGLPVSTGFKVLYYLALVIPFLAIYTSYKMEKVLLSYINEKDPEFKGRYPFFLIPGFVLPLFMNVFDMVEKDRLFNKIVDLYSGK